VADLTVPLAVISLRWIEGLCAALMLAPLAFFLACACYLCLLLCVAASRRGRIARLSPLRSLAASRQSQPAQPNPASGGEVPRIVLLIPAHDEELVIGAALAPLAGLDYPRDRYRVVVIADNCSDRTAAIAREHGAEAMERCDPSARGKGYALAWALDRLCGEERGASLEPAASEAGSGDRGPEPARGDAGSGEGGFDAVVIIDADTLVAPNMLRIFAEKLRAGDSAIQARYDVLNAGETWRTRLMSCALALAHIVKPLGRERLGLSDGLKGNGMCFARSVVAAVPWSGESITEDIEYTIRLCRAGYRVAFAPETAVWAQMPTTAKESASQRERWEGGRYRLIARYAPALLLESLRRRSPALFDRALDLMIPPFAEMVAAPCVLLTVCAVAALALHTQLFALLAVGWGVVLVLQAGYLAGGMWVARMPMSIAAAVLCAPGYMLWKFGLYAAMLLSRSAVPWKRTARRKLDA
jgi:cellulose synthase/poly-beta-1,6-N-acetylglucosamine synthase-like glycosyltransferase